MMTTMAAIMGAIPIALGLGAGAEARQPLGIAVAGGLFISQILTLYITPVIYLYLEKCQEFAMALPARLRGTSETGDAAPAATPISPKLGIDDPSSHKIP
jgi:HAE1 family hydrophobic/amphiphilic exporter-1